MRAGKHSDQTPPFIYRSISNPDKEIQNSVSEKNVKKQMNRHTFVRKNLHIIDKSF